eukprot:6456872-Amphidinium_carterae.2
MGLRAIIVCVCVLGVLNDDDQVGHLKRCREFSLDIHWAQSCRSQPPADHDDDDEDDEDVDNHDDDDDG